MQKGQAKISYHEMAETKMMVKGKVYKKTEKYLMKKLGKIK